MLRKLAAFALVAMLTFGLLPAGTQASGGVSTALSFPDLVPCEDRPASQGGSFSCTVRVTTTAAVAGGFDVQMGFAWVASGGIAGPDAVGVAFAPPVLSCPATAGAVCGMTRLYINATMATWAPDTWEYGVYATRLCSGVPCPGADESSAYLTVRILRPVTLGVGCVPSSPALFTRFTCTATVTDAGGTGPASTPSSPSRVVWPFDDGANQHPWGECDLVPQAAPHTAACDQVLWVSFFEDGDIIANWAGDADHSGDMGMGHIQRTKRDTQIVPGCPASVLIGAQIVCRVEVWDMEWEDVRGESGQGVDADVKAASPTPGSGLPTTLTFVCHADRVPFPDPSRCDFAFSPTTHGTKALHLRFDGSSIYQPADAFANITVTRRATSTIISCGPLTTVVNTPTHCAVNVTDTTFSGPPTGSVAFSVDAAPAAGTFSPGSCTLVAVPTSYPSSTCTTSFTPALGIAAAGDAFLALRASYGGDATRETSADTDSLKVTPRASATTLECTDDVLVPLSGAAPAATCSASVADASPPTAVAPSGTLEWTGAAGTGLPGAFPSTTTCPLALTAPYACEVPPFVPTELGDLLVSTQYSGDVDHLGSLSSDTIRVHAATSIVYTGAQAVSQGSAFTAAALARSAFPSCYQDRAADATGVAFYLDRDPSTGVAGAWRIPGYAGTNADGKATLEGIATAGWSSGAYLITARFEGDARCDPSTDEATLLVAGAGDVAHGGGWVALNGRTNFAFVVTKVPGSDPPAYRGQFLMVNNGKWKLEGTLHGLVREEGSPSKCAADGVGALFYASVDPSTGATTWLPAIDGAATSFGLYFEDAGGGRRATDKLAIQIGHQIVSPPEPHALPKATSENAASLRSGDVMCR